MQTASHSQVLAHVERLLSETEDLESRPSPDTTQALSRLARLDRIGNNVKALVSRVKERKTLDEPQPVCCTVTAVRTNGARGLRVDFKSDCFEPNAWTLLMRVSAANRRIVQRFTLQSDMSCITLIPEADAGFDVCVSLVAVEFSTISVPLLSCSFAATDWD